MSIPLFNWIVLKLVEIVRSFLIYNNDETFEVTSVNL